MKHVILFQCSLSGRQRAILSEVGIREFCNDILQMSVLRGPNCAMHSFRGQVGYGTSSVTSIKSVRGVQAKEFSTEPLLE